MDWSLVIFAALILFFSWRGYKNGLPKMLARLLSLLAGYAASIFFSSALSQWLESITSLQGIVAFACAALLLFFGAGIIVSLLFWGLQKLWPVIESPSAVSRYGGAGIGLLLGLVVAFAVVWSYAFLRDVHFAEQAAAATPPQNSRIEKLVNRAAGKALGSAMEMASAQPEISRLSSALLESPAELTAQARRLGESTDMRVLLQDPDNQAVLDSGDAEAVRQLPAFQSLVHNPDLLALAASAGMLDQASSDSEAIEAVLAERLTDIWGRVQRVKRDARVQEILADPEFVHKIQSGNPVDLITNQQLLELADIIFSDDAAAQLLHGDNEPNGAQSKPRDEVQIYSWTDSSGRTHYSDTPPDP